MSAELKLPNLKEDEILSIVEPIMDSCLEGSNEGDHKKHTKDFTDRMKSIVTPEELKSCLLYTSPSPRDRTRSRMPSSA